MNETIFYIWIAQIQSVVELNHHLLMVPFISYSLRHKITLNEKGDQINPNLIQCSLSSSQPSNLTSPLPPSRITTATSHCTNPLLHPSNTCAQPIPSKVTL